MILKPCRGSLVHCADEHIHWRFEQERFQSELVPAVASCGRTSPDRFLYIGRVQKFPHSFDCSVTAVADISGAGTGLSISAIALQACDVAVAGLCGHCFPSRCRSCCPNFASCESLEHGILITVFCPDFIKLGFEVFLSHLGFLSLSLGTINVSQNLVCLFLKPARWYFAG
jgi:hypothetical protein